MTLSLNFGSATKCWARNLNSLCFCFFIFRMRIVTMLPCSLWEIWCANKRAACPECLWQKWEKATTSGRVIREHTPFLQGHAALPKGLLSSLKIEFSSFLSLWLGALLQYTPYTTVLGSPKYKAISKQQAQGKHSMFGSSCGHCHHTSLFEWFWLLRSTKS